MSNYVGTSEYIDGSGFTCDVCGTRYGDDASGELSNQSNGERLVCMMCSFRNRPENDHYFDDPLQGVRKA